MADTLLWGNTRPKIRVGTTSAQDNGTHYVLNQPPANIDIDFPKQIILNESSLTGSLNEHIIGHRGIFTFDYEHLDKPSCERLIDIFNTSNDIYIRPCFNFYKEYQVRPVNAWELDRMGKSNQSYKGTLQFETINLESSIPSESYGAFNFNGTTKVADASLASTITGDISVEMWIKTPSAFGNDRLLFTLTGSGPDWTVYLDWYQSNTNYAQLRFTTAGSSSLTSNTILNVNTWYFLQICRVNTDDKYIIIDGTQDNTGSDSLAANSVNAAQLGNTTAGFQGLCQIFRIYNANLGTSYYAQHSIEAVTSLDYLQLWWDFSQGSGNDLSDSNNDGTVTGSASYSEESFPDSGSEYMT